LHEPADFATIALNAMAPTGPRESLRVSVVTPAYNQGAFLRDTIDSVLAQDHAPIEYLVLDDGSTDHTREVLASYGDRVRWRSHANRGQTATINTGWAEAQGDVVAWLNSDDTFLPGAVRTAVAYLDAHPETAIVFGDTLFTDAAGKPLGPSRPVGSFDYERFVVECENPIAQPSAFVRRKVIDDVGLLDPHYRYFMDWDFWLRAGLRHRIDHIPELLSTYRLHAESMTVASTGRHAPELEYMYRKFFAQPSLPEWLERARPRAMANMYFTQAAYLMRAGQPGAARRTALRAWRANPLGAVRPSALHKLAYCALGQTRLYAAARRLAGGRGPESPGDALR
jgi:glycosyltransferase involved in cell wall biosynthesis